MPSISELQSFYADPVIRNLFSTGQYYWSSYYGWTNNYYGSLTDRFHRIIVSSNSSDNNGYIADNNKVRCVRQHNATAPSLVPDPPAFQYPSGNVFTALSSLSTTYTSNLSTPTQSSSPLTFFSHNALLTISLSGSGSPQYRINGGAWQTAGTIAPGPNQVEFRANSPATYGAENAVTVNIGSSSGTWRIRTYDSTVTKNIFVTSTSYQGNLGGVTGANNICRTRAQFAGLSDYGTYQALMGSSSNSGLDNIGWNWGTLKNMAGQTVATDPGSLVSFSLSAAPNRTEFGAVTVNSRAWTGLHAGNPTLISATSYLPDTCANWTSGATSITGVYGDPGGTGSQFASVSATSNCATSYPIYCVGPNPDLPNITCPGAIDMTASKYASGTYSVTIPANCQVTFKLWGGAGGIDTNCNGAGGAGGYAVFTETPSTNTTYYYSVGGRGGASAYGAGGSGASGFAGGTGHATTGSGGGGASVLWRNTISTANILAVAAGGGGNRNQCGTSGIKAGGQTGNSYSSTVTNGQIGGCAGTTAAGGGGAGFDGASGGGGIGGNCSPGHGGQNWVLTGMGITSSTVAGSGQAAGNFNDSDMATVVPTSTNACCGGNYHLGSGYYGAPGAGGVIVRY